MLPPMATQNAASKRWDRTDNTRSTSLSQDIRNPASHNIQQPSVKVARRQCSVAKKPHATTKPSTNIATPSR